MPHVSKHDQIRRKGLHSDRDRDVLAFEANPRDDLSGAIAGDENEGPAGRDKTHRGSTNLKSRSSKANIGKVPIR